MYIPESTGSVQAGPAARSAAQPRPRSPRATHTSLAPASLHQQGRSGWTHTRSTRRPRGGGEHAWLSLVSFSGSFVSARLRLCERRVLSVRPLLRSPTWRSTLTVSSRDYDSNGREVILKGYLPASTYTSFLKRFFKIYHY